MDENEIGAVSVEKVHPGHKKQRLTYLKLTGLKLGYVLNFGEALMKDGITHDFSVPLCLWCARPSLVPLAG